MAATRTTVLLAVLITSYIAVMAESCPVVSAVNPASGSADPSFIFTITGVGFSDVVSITSTAGQLNYTIQSGSVIRFSFQPGFSGTGRVNVTLMVSSGSSCSAVSVAVYITKDPPVLQAANEGVLILESGRNVSISCSILGSTATPAWYYNHIPILSRTGTRILSDSLSFEPLSSDNSGWYTCAAANQYGRTERDYLAIAGTAPKLMIPPLPIPDYYNVQYGSRVVLPCIGTGSPRNSVTWYENGVMVVPETNGMSIESLSGSLVINNFTMSEARYSCLLSNPLGKTSSMNATVKIAETSQFTPSPLKPFYNLVVRSPDIGDSLSLDCYQGSGGGTYQWFKNYVVIAGAVSSTLVITTTATGAESGHYCCRISFSDQDVPNRDLRCTIVNVRLAPEYDHTPPNSLSLPSGGSVNLLCSGVTPNGIDPPLFNWTVNNATIPEQGNPRISAKQERYGLTTLVIRDARPSDSGVYACRDLQNSVELTSDVRIIETCGINNLLGNPGAEDGTAYNWTASPSGTSFIVNADGEMCFRITQPGVSIQQSVSLPIGTQILRFSGRMRAESSSLQPQIILTITDESSVTITRPFPTSTAWQWVEHRRELTVTSPTHLSVVLTAINSSPSTDSVYFDDVCLSLSEDNSTHQLQPTSTPEHVGVSSSTGVAMSPSVEPPQADLTVIIIASAASAGTVLLAIVIITLISVCCCTCVVCIGKRRKTSGEFVPQETFNKPGEKGQVDKAISLTSFNKDSQKPHSGGSHHYLPNPTAQQTTPLPSSPPEYLDVIDHLASYPISVPVSGGVYMEVDSTLTRSYQPNDSESNAEQYAYVSNQQVDRMANRPPMPTPDGHSHYY